MRGIELVAAGRHAALLRRADKNFQCTAVNSKQPEISAFLISRNIAPPAVQEDLDSVDDAAVGRASEVEPKFVSYADPASQWIGAQKGPVFFAYATNYLIDSESAVILDVEASRAIRQAEVGATRTMIERMRDRFGLHPDLLASDTAYGSGEMLGWLDTRVIEAHIPVIDKSERLNVAFPATDVIFDPEADEYTCPGGNKLK